MFSGKDAKLLIKYIMCCHYWLFCLWSGNHSLLIPKLSLNKCICYYTDGPHFCVSCWEVSFMLQIVLGYKQANLKVFFFFPKHIQTNSMMLSLTKLVLLLICMRLMIKPRKQSHPWIHKTSPPSSNIPPNISIFYVKDLLILFPRNHKGFFQSFSPI